MAYKLQTIRKVTEKIHVPTVAMGTHEAHLRKPPAPELVADQYAASLAPSVVKRELKYILQYQYAHVIMLCEQDIISKDDAKKLLDTLRWIEETGAEGFEWNPENEGLYPCIEALCIARLGYHVGGKLLTGRTRGGAELTPRRLLSRIKMVELLEEAGRFRKTLLDLAEEHVETVMPYYTNRQYSQPRTFGYYLLGFADKLGCDLKLLQDAYANLNLGCVEAATGGGTGLPVRRERVAELLGYNGLVEHCQLAYGTPFGLQALSALIILTNDIWRLHEYVYEMTRNELDIITLADQYTSTSFFMAHKRNPSGLATVKPAKWSLDGQLMSALAKRRDGFDRGGIVHLFRPIQTILPMIKTFRGALATMTVNKELWRKRAEASPDSSELVDTLVMEKGLSYREGHRIVGTLCRTLEDAGKRLPDATPELLDEAAEEILGKPVNLSGDSLRKAMDPLVLIQRRDHVTGGTGPNTVRKAIQIQKARVKEEEEWLAERRGQIQRAEEKLEKIVNQYLET